VSAGASLAPAATADPDGRVQPLVALDAVSVAFPTRTGLFRMGEVRAVNGVSLAIAGAETLGLVGESGSGKTTVGRVSLRLIEPTAGRVYFDGIDITSTPEHDLGWLRKRAQIVFQDPFSSLNPYMRVVDLVEEPLVIDGVRGKAERWERARRALEEVDLVPAGRWAARYPTAMSGGQRQRVGIARALVRNPEYIVADEPVSMIDASSRIEILQLLRGLQTVRGVAFLYITHDIASARHFADRIAVMYQGSLVEVGPAKTVIDRPLHPYTRGLIAAVPEPDPANRFRRRAVGGVAQAAGEVVHPGCPHGPDRANQPALLLPSSGDPTHLVACHVEAPHGR
jgi:peptide/nickel transport system ATP-binding protein